MPQILIIALSLISILAFGWNFIIPLYQQALELRTTVTAKEIELSHKEEYASHLEFLLEKLGKNEEAISKIDYAFPDNPEVSSFLEFLQHICSETGLSIKAIEDPESKISRKNDKVTETSVGVIMVGTYDNLLEFLSKIEKSARLIEVENILFSRSIRKGSTLEKEEISGETFSFKVIFKIRSWVNNK